MKRFIVSKEVNAKPMSRLEYNVLRGWKVPHDENPSDDGWLIEDMNGKPNHPDYEGYLQWLPHDEFVRQYKPVV